MGNEGAGWEASGKGEARGEGEQNFLGARHFEAGVLSEKREKQGDSREPWVWGPPNTSPRGPGASGEGASAPSARPGAQGCPVTATPVPKLLIFCRCVEVRKSAQGVNCVYDVQNYRP